MKKVPFDQLVVGNSYYTECGIWNGRTTFVGTLKVGKRIKYRFTYGSVDNWQNQFGHCALKSEINVYEL